MTKSTNTVQTQATDAQPRRRFVAAAGLGATAALVAGSAHAAKPRKAAEGLGMPWEDQYGYAQAVKLGDTIYVSGQLSHDDKGNMMSPAPLDASGKISDHSNMESQMRQSYVNAKRILAKFGASLADVVEEVIYVTDMETAFAAAGKVRKEAYASQKPVVASTILVTPRLALPTQLIEIKFIARV